MCLKVTEKKSRIRIKISLFPNIASHLVKSGRSILAEEPFLILVLFGIVAAAGGLPVNEHGIRAFLLHTRRSCFFLLLVSTLIYGTVHIHIKLKITIRIRIRISVINWFRICIKVMSRIRTRIRINLE
jgi:hypothetical protein